MTRLLMADAIAMFATSIALAADPVGELQATKKKLASAAKKRCESQATKKETRRCREDAPH